MPGTHEPRHIRVERRPQGERRFIHASLGFWDHQEYRTSSWSHAATYVSQLGQDTRTTPAAQNEGSHSPVRASPKPDPLKRCDWIPEVVGYLRSTCQGIEDAASPGRVRDSQSNTLQAKVLKVLKNRHEGPMNTFDRSGSIR